MRHVCFILLFFFLLSAPMQVVQAASFDRETLVAELRALLIERIQTLLAREQARVAGATNERLLPSAFYTGDYEALYLIEDSSLVPYGKTQWSLEDHIYWKLWEEVLGTKEAQRYMREFRIYNDPGSAYDAFVEHRGDDEWILGVNLARNSVADENERFLTTELFVHEYAHILYYYDTQARDDFIDAYWSPRHRSTLAYVSEYAQQNEEEDFAESFRYFVLEERPDDNHIRDQKVHFFYDDSAYRTLRRDIRERINN